MSQPRFQTVGRHTFFSRLDFRSKLAVFISVTVIAALWNNQLYVGLLMLSVLAACIQTGISGSYLRLMFRVMAPFFILMLLTHGFFNKQHVLRLSGASHLTPWFTLPTSWWLVGGGMLSQEGLLYGITVLSKSMTFLLLVPLCVFTTDPNNLVLGLVRLRLPYKLVFVFSSSLRFFPLIFDEIQAVQETQRLRGHALETMGALERVRTYAKIAVPVILGSMFKAQQIEVVLQSKGFSGKADRTYLHASELRGVDWGVIALAAAGMGAAIVLSAAVGLGKFPGAQ